MPRGRGSVRTMASVLLAPTGCGEEAEGDVRGRKLGRHLAVTSRGVAACTGPRLANALADGLASADGGGAMSLDDRDPRPDLP